MKKTSLLCLFALTLLSVRLTAQTPAQTDGPLFKSYFEDANEFLDLWKTVDANQDRYTWALDQLSVDPDTYSLRISTYEDISDRLPEYFVTKQPLHLDTGLHNLSFYHLESGFPEHYAVFWGTSDTLDLMDMLLDREEMNRSLWAGDYVNFNVNKEGDYYFAFAAYHEKGRGYYLNIDAIEINKGEFVGTPDLQLSLNLPHSSCALGSAESLSVHIDNIGTSSVSKVRIAYTVDGSDTVKVDKDLYLGAFESTDITLATIDLSSVGVHKVRAKVEVLEYEENAEREMTNNTSYGEVRKWNPVEGVPFETDFSREEDVQNWDTENDSWGYFPKQGYVLAFGDGAIYSRCVPLTGGHQYRFSFNYLAGHLSGTGNVFPEKFEILYGISGTDISTWKKLATAREHYTGLMFVDKDYTFTPASDGNYGFAIRCPEGTDDYLAFKRITVSEVFEYDAALVKMGPLPTRVPAEQLLTDFAIPVKLRNMGRQTLDNVKVSVALDQKKAGEETFNIGSPETVVDTATRVSGAAINATGAVTIGKTIEISAEVTIPDREDGYVSDNTKSHSVAVTDIELACDEATLEMCGNSEGLGGFEIGSPLTLLSSDTLTGIRVLWTQSEVYEITLTLYKFDPLTEKLGEKIFYESYRKTSSAGACDYETPAILLEAGTYLFTVQGKGYALVYDGSAGGRLYLVENERLEYQPGTGAAAIRGLFGHNARLLDRDAMVTEINYPEAEGYYSANQTIKAKIANNGRETMQVTAKCSIDGTELEGPLSLAVPGYGKQEISFTGDLSVLGAHTVKIWLEAENDEDLSNNEISLVFRSIEPEDPYVMDFEHCEDFSLDHFNPVWRSVDMDSAQTCGISSITFPHQREPMAFIAFNPEAVGGQYTNVVTYEGQKLGMAFSSLGKANNDWLISPLLELPEDSAWIKLMVRSYNAKYGLEKYQILVSETGEMDDFDTVYFDSAAARAWTEVTVPLDAYAGKEVYIAVRCVSNDVFIFMIDYIRVSKPQKDEEGEWNEPGKAFSGLGLSLHPNPSRHTVTITAKNSAPVINRISIIDMSGRTVYTSQQLGGRDFFRYNVEGLRPGLYMARVESASSTAVLKFVVEK